MVDAGAGAGAGAVLTDGASCAGFGAGVAFVAPAFGADAALAASAFGA